MTRDETEAATATTLANEQLNESTGSLRMPSPRRH